MTGHGKLPAERSPIMKTLRLPVLWAGLLLALVLHGCMKAPEGQDRIVIGLAVPSLTHPFFIYLEKSVKEEAKALGVDIISVDAEDVAAKQMAVVENFIARRVDGVLMSPVGADALLPAVEALNEAGIPVATVDRKVNGGDVVVHVGADNVEGGRVAGRYIIEQLGGKGTVIQLEGVPGASPTIDRKTGFEETVAGSGIDILASQTAQFQRAQGQAAMENLLQAHPDVDAVYAANDEMILGAIEAIEGHGIDPAEIVTIGYDAIPDAIDYIEKGRLDATIEQFPGEQARMALRSLVAFIREGTEPPQKEVYIPPVAVSRSNLDRAEKKP
jgi:ribose transport system substrate-binding protein